MVVLPIPDGFQPIAGGRAQRKPPVIVNLEFMYPGGIPAEPARDEELQSLRDRSRMSGPLSGGVAMLTTGYWLTSLRDNVIRGFHS